MRKRILEQWLRHYGFRFTEDVSNMLILDAERGDVAALLFIEQAEAWQNDVAKEDRLRTLRQKLLEVQIRAQGRRLETKGP